MTGAAEGPHLVPLPERLREVDPDVSDAVIGLVTAEHDRWRQLHDRLIALIASLLDVAAQDRELAEVINQVIGSATVSLDELIGTGVDPVEIAALLRSHGSKGTVEVGDDAVVFRHACGSGQHFWRQNPETAKVEPGEVPGVPAGRPRYCARCIRSIAVHGGAAWTVDPPADAVEPCTWTVRRPGPPLER